MAADIIARALATEAASAAAEFADTYTSGFTFKGVADYTSALPDSGNSAGDIYLVKYAGSTGTTPLNVRYVWGNDGGTDQWIPMSTGPYALAFNDTTDWTAISGGAYAISVAESAHNCGANPRVDVWREVSGSYAIVVGSPTNGYTLTRNSDGDVQLSVETADYRFAGQLIIS